MFFIIARYPGGRMLSAFWSDKNGNLWLFSGAGWGEQYSHYGELSDLWFGIIFYIINFPFFLLILQLTSNIYFFLNVSF